MSFYQKSLDEGRLANFGPCYFEAQKRIEKLMTYNCLVSNATVGLELALRARFKKGARILIPSFTFKATYLAVINADMVPVVHAVDGITWTLIPFDIQDADVDGAIVVSPFGHEIDFSAYEDVGVPIIYDLAGSWGNFYKGSHVAVYSWHATKRFSVGEGACIVSSDYALVKEIERLSNFGRTNAKLSEIQCAIACANLEYGIKSYKNVYESYFERFVDSDIGRCLLNYSSCSLMTFSFPKEKIYNIITNPIFEARRYYYPLIEDLYQDAEVLMRTPKDHPTRSVIALPRDVTNLEFVTVVKTLESL